MPLYDYECPECAFEGEQFALMVDRKNQKCPKCSTILLQVYRPTPRYKPFNPYFDIGLGVEINSLAHRKRVMKQQAMDYRDHPSKGDTSARLDKIADRKRYQARMR
jgi:putative FmdB family regulatory protein